MNRIDLLADVSARGEGILSLTLAPNGAGEYDKLLERIRFFESNGMNQLLLICYEPNAMKIGEIAPWEMRLVKQESKKMEHREMFFDNLQEIRREHPDLPVVATVNVGEAICYGIGRLFARFKENGVDGIDTPAYMSAADPIAFRKRAREQGIHFIGAIYPEEIDMQDPYHMHVLDEVIKASEGEIFFVPTMQGSTEPLKGERFKAIVNHIREVQYKNNIKARIISISGINTPEDAYQMVHVAGTDGVHFASALIRRLFAEESYEDMGVWLNEVKAAMQR